MSRTKDISWVIKVSDPNTGEQIAVIDQFKFLQVSEQLNKPGYYQLIFDAAASPDLLDSVELDYQFDFFRQGRLIGALPQKEFTAVNRTYVRAEFRSGIVQHSLFGRGLEDFLQRRIVASRADVVADLTPASEVCGGVYNAAVDLVMWASAKLHAGDLATTGNGRLDDGVTQGLTVTVPGVGTGDVWALGS